MQELRKFVAPEFVFGQGALALTGQYAQNFGAKKVLLVTDDGIRSAGWVTPVADSLESVGISYTVFADVTPNPRVEEVMAGADRYRREGCDIIVAVGGGSPMDCAKGIGIVSTNNRNILAFEGIDNVDVPAPPLVCIPTTAGTSADVSQFAIINDPDRQVKIAIVSKAVVPDVALIDPKATTTMDPYLTACTGMDALTHAIEAFVSTANSPVTDLFALEAIRLISANLLDAIVHPDNDEFRNHMMLGSLKAGLAFSNASLGIVHAMAHSLGGLLDLPHGECNSILLDHVMTFNYPEAAGRYEKIGEAMGMDLSRMTAEEKRHAVINGISGLKRSAGRRQTRGGSGGGRGGIFGLGGEKHFCGWVGHKTPGATPGGRKGYFEEGR